MSSTGKTICSSPGCGKEASELSCPNCNQLGLPPAYFCSQECFKSSWSVHKLVHGTGLNNTDVSKPESSRAMTTPEPVRPVENVSSTEEFSAAVVPATELEIQQTGLQVSLSSAYSDFKHTPHIPPPKRWDEFGIPKDLWGIIQLSPFWYIRRHHMLLPTDYFGCPPCASRGAIYSIYAGLKRGEEREILRVDEVSDKSNRYFCGPLHPFRLEFRQYVPIPGDASNSGYDHISDELKTKLKNWVHDGKTLQEGLKKFYVKNQAVIFTAVRNDGQRLCCPCKILRLFTCFPICADGMHMYAGKLKKHFVDEKGRPIQSASDLKDAEYRLVGSVTQPICDGTFLPTFHLRSDGVTDDSEPFGSLRGPCIFGGCFEMCVRFQFLVEANNPEVYKTKLATIKKQKIGPQSTIMDSQFSDASVFYIFFSSDENMNKTQHRNERLVSCCCLQPVSNLEPNKNKRQSSTTSLDDEAAESSRENSFIETAESIFVTPSQKLTIISAQILADYLYFNGNTEMCKNDIDALYCYYCYCSTFGCMIPWYCCFPKQQ
jgi:hypothetical protein